VHIMPQPVQPDGTLGAHQWWAIASVGSVGGLMVDCPKRIERARQ
jgi:hypothetical protein